MVRQPERIIVIGGGLAGLSASTRILQGGYSGELLLLEKSPFVGGRTGSVNYKGQTLDLGQHMHVSGFEYYRKFMDEIGLSEDLKTPSRLDVEFRDKSGNIGRVKSNRLPPPLHLLSATYNFPFISTMDKLSLLGPVISALIFGSRGRSSEKTFGDWLREKGASERSIEKLWNQIIVPTLNAKVDEVSVPMGLMILKRVLLDKQGGKLGRLDGSLSKIGDEAVCFITNHGGEVLTSSPVETIVLKDEGRNMLKLKGGKQLKADLVLSAVPGHQLEEMLPDSELEAFSNPFWELEWNSIINVHLFFRESVMDQGFFGFLEGTAGWVFKVTDHEGDPGKHICLTISDPGELEEMLPDDLVSRVRSDLASPLPRIEATELEDAVALYQPRATFVGSPESSSLRPPQDPPHRNLYLAGDWTDTGWPATMEGAVRSGYYAAEEVLELVQ